MIQGDRKPDSGFQPNHDLYRRCKADEIIGGHIIGTSIRYDNMSTNWSKYSKPWDVLFDHPGYGIACFKVRDLPCNLPTEDPPGTPVKPHSFRPQHQPLLENYSHTEIWAYKEDTRLLKIPSNTVKKEFRQIMSDKSFILMFPQK